jgi:MFS transporter, SP family, sugar:H+ symporter
LNAPYANLQAKVGFVFAVTAVGAILFGFFFIPECKNRSLEDIDRLFDARVPLRKFPEYVLPADPSEDEHSKLDTIKGTVIQEESLAKV